MLLTSLLMIFLSSMLLPPHSYAAEQLANGGFSGNADGWSTANALYDASNYDGAMPGSLMSEVTSKNTLVVGTAQQGTFSVLAADIVTLQIKWSKQSVTVDCSVNEINVQFEDTVNNPGIWQTIWGDTIVPAVGSPTAFTDSGSQDVSSYFTVDSSYNFRVEMQVRTPNTNGSECRAWVDTISFDVSAPPCTAEAPPPGDFNVTDGDGQAYLSWTPNGGTNTHYYIYREDLGPVELNIVTADVGTYNDTDVTAGQGYIYYLRGYDQGMDCFSADSEHKSVAISSTDPFRVMTCNDCHGTPPSDSLMADTSIRNSTDRSVRGRHANPYHVTSPDIGACPYCHNTPGLTEFGHMNLVITMNSSIHGQGGFYDKNSDNVYDAVDQDFAQTRLANLTNLGTCVNTLCHGQQTGSNAGRTNIRSPVWGTDSGSPLCARCHGMVDGQPAKDLEGHTNIEDPQVGAHVSHLTNAAGISAITGCWQCHGTVYSLPGQAGHFDDGPPVDFGWGAISTKGGTLSPTHNFSTGQCSEVYCHDGQYFKNGWSNTSNGQVNFPAAWNDITWIDDTTPGTANCINKCHGYPPASPHQQNNQCDTCHNTLDSDNFTFSLGNRTKHIDGMVDLSTCLDCHKDQQGIRRPIVSNGVTDGDFKKASRHVSDGSLNQIVTEFDCIICHVEGDTGSVTGSISTTLQHNENVTTGDVGMRNVDNVGNPGTEGTHYWNWPGSGSATAADRNNMDRFCLNCHDADGASTIVVNDSNSGMLLGGAVGSNATTPFNVSDNLRNNNDGFTTRTRVIDVKGQFYAGTGGSGTGYDGNPSQHALPVLGAGTYDTGPRYGSQDSNWGADPTWNTTHTLRSASDIDTLRETATLHCSDCHLVEQNAHGATSSWHMLLTGDADDFTTDYDQASKAASDLSSVVCYKCHSDQVYHSNGSNKAPRQAAGSRFDHKDNDSNVIQDYASGTHDVKGSYLGPFCLLCHGGDGFGRIHGRGSATDGDDGTYTPPDSGLNLTKYRFMPGAWMKWSPGTAGDPAWEVSTSDAGCYFDASADTTWSNCGKHNGQNQTGKNTNYARPARY